MIILKSLNIFLLQLKKLFVLIYLILVKSKKDQIIEYNYNLSLLSSDEIAAQWSIYAGK